jgi:hypothetical protein
LQTVGALWNTRRLRAFVHNPLITSRFDPENLQDGAGRMTLYYSH